VSIQRNGEEMMPHGFFITPRIMPDFDGILGNDWFEDQKANISYENSCIETPNFSIPFQRKIQADPKVHSLRLVEPQLTGLYKSCLKNKLPLLENKKREDRVCAELLKTDKVCAEPLKTDKVSESLTKLDKFDGELEKTHQDIPVSREHETEHTTTNERIRTKVTFSEEDALDQGINLTELYERDFRVYAQADTVIPANHTGLLAVTTPNWVKQQDIAKDFLVEPYTKEAGFKMARTVLNTENTWCIPYVNFCDYPVTFNRGDTIGWG
jgi:hypothetical protein